MSDQAASPGSPPLDPEVAKWEQAVRLWKAKLEELAEVAKPLIDEERTMRAALFAHFFPSPVEGTNTHVMSDGYQLKGVYPIDRSVDEAVYATLRTATLMELPPELVDRLHIDRTQYKGDELAVEVLRLNLDKLVRFEPKLDTKEYRTLTAEQMVLFDRCLTTKPGSMSLKMADPAKPKAGKAEGL